MKKLYFLRALLDIFLFFAALAGAGLLILIPILLFGSDSTGIPFEVNGEEVTVISMETQVILLLLFVGFGTFVYGVFLLRKVLTLFSMKRILDDLVIKYIGRIGKCFIGASFLMTLPISLYKALSKAELDIQLRVGGFDFFLFTICLGLFFIVLSEMLQIAKQQKEEKALSM
ncbi:DUF2975 domain-containing protein [Flavobacterium kingsejongi]|uniref:DUF2975 domain-containing protein n=1 Tax=Flavobacterium kingsejongi TaxID=1678728 RepID=A0A2S1LM86_9FLAO|nr:DUF2975 domain-containing protein [Flavobacterium kingsejongi]AWG24798.1 hypothetical protein FK004_05930 [Flavobacterium kingsejongi]